MLQAFIALNFYRLHVKKKLCNKKDQNILSSMRWWKDVSKIFIVNILKCQMKF